MRNPMRIGAVAVLILGGMLWGVALSTPQVGTPLSSAEATQICGGCTGADKITCKGASCPSSTVYSLGHPGVNYDGSGDDWCGGNTNCAMYFKGQVLCGT